MREHAAYGLCVIGSLVLHGCFGYLSVDDNDTWVYIHMELLSDQLWGGALERLAPGHYLRAANPTEFSSKEKALYTFFMKLSPTSQVLLPRPRSLAAIAPTHSVGLTLPALMLLYEVSCASKQLG